jgi:16S rRNA (adenine(1408)-N(1))-methyltransferase
MDLGTGDGRAVIDRARREVDTLVIGIDASSAAMAETSRRAARAPRRGGLPNALFVVAAAEHPPVELAGVADELSIIFPWGSLLAGALALDPAAADGIASLVVPMGCVRILASAVDDDRLALGPLDTDDAAGLSARWSCHGLRLSSYRRATAEELDASGSSWARRLAAGRRRPTWRIELVKEDGPPERRGDAPAAAVVGASDVPRPAR